MKLLLVLVYVWDFIESCKEKLKEDICMKIIAAFSGAALAVGAIIFVVCRKKRK